MKRVNVLHVFLFGFKPEKKAVNKSLQPHVLH